MTGLVISIAPPIEITASTMLSKMLVVELSLMTSLPKIELKSISPKRKSWTEKNTATSS